MVTPQQFLDDPLRAAQAFANELGPQAGRVVQSIVPGTASVGAVGRDGRVSGPAAQVFGSDPQQFILNATRKFSGSVRELLTRTASRTGSSTFSAQSGNGKRVSIESRPKASDSAARLSLLLALHAQHHPAQLADEAGRMAANLNQGRGLEGCIDWPAYMVNVGAGEPRGLFGIDDAILFGAIVSIIVAIIGVVGPIVIQGLIAVVGSVSKEGGDALSGFLGKKEAPPPDNTIFGLDSTLVIVLAAAAAAALLLFGKKKGASS